MSVLSFENARRMVEQQAATISASSTEDLPLLDSSQRILAEPVHADRDIPPFPRSTRDGYAIRTADLVSMPAKLELCGEIKAGIAQPPNGPNSGESFAIMTGAPVPAAADAVVMVEHASLDQNVVTIHKAVAAGENIVAKGAEARRGVLLLDRGIRMNEGAIALAASVGKAHLRVFARPQVAVLTTGDEIVGLDSKISETQIRNSNSYSLAAQVRQAGGEPEILPIAPDEPRRLRELIERGLRADLLIMTGGVSMGRYDLVEPVLADLRAEFFFTGAEIQPGRPVVFGCVPQGADAAASKPSSAGNARGGGARRYFFGLPGNPISTMVTFELFARPLLEALAGQIPRPLRFLHARLRSEVRTKPGLTRFLPAILTGAYDKVGAELVPWHGSGDIAARTRANCFLVIGADRETISAGEWMPILTIHG